MSHQMSQRHVVTSKRFAAGVVAVAALAAAAVSGGDVHAANYSFRFKSVPAAGSFGIDNPATPGYDLNPCQVGWDANGALIGWNANGNVIPAPSVPGAVLRFELYPESGRCGAGYTGWGNVGGIHFETSSYANMGEIVLPDARSTPGVFRMVGNIVGTGSIPDGRVKVDTFQVGDFQHNGQVAYGGFASTASRGNRWSGGVTWPGQYGLFVEDTQTGRKIHALTTITASTIPTIDLDAICFGLDPCVYLSGQPGTTAGAFHPTPPTRILDTRRGLGITNGPVRGGDGRNGDPNPLFRLDSALNHEIQVTGRFGIPSAGVSAVLLNVTAVDAPGDSYLTLFPKPPRVGNVYDDQAGFREVPATSNLNIANRDPVPNLVLARVGAGGKIRILNSWGPTHVIADIAGWFGTGGAHTDGAGFLGLVPDRALDTRNGIGGPAARVPAGGSRTIDVRGRHGVPANATSVVVNITAVGASRPGFTTAFPDGQRLPDASNLNYGAGVVRANTAVVQIGTNGKIRVQASESDVDLIVDVLGSFGPGGGRVTAIDPTRFVDSRFGLGTSHAKWGQFESREVQIAGVHGVPANAKAVIANITAVNGTSQGFLTAWPTGSTRPDTSNLNFPPGQAVPNLVLLQLGSGGRLSIFNERGTTDVIVDVMGYVT